MKLFLEIKSAPFNEKYLEYDDIKKLLSRLQQQIESQFDGRTLVAEDHSGTIYGYNGEVAIKWAVKEY